MSLSTETKKESGMKVGNMEYRLRFVLMLLLAVGLIMTFDLAYNPQSVNFRSEYISNIIKYLSLTIIGITLAWALRYASSNMLSLVSHFLMPFALFLLIATFIWGEEIHGAQRWLTIFGISFQTSEFFKFSVALGLAYALTPFRNSQFRKTISFLKILFWLELLVGLFLVYKQPNHSAVMIIAFAIFVIALLSRVKWYYVVSFGLIVIIALGFLIMKDPEKSKRVWAFIKRPAETESVELSDERYQAREALKAVASGGWLGRGIGRSIAKYSLPATSTDFVFAIIVEEFGFVGALFVMLCFFTLIHTALGAASREPDEFLRLASLGLTLFMALSIILHIAVNLDLTPTTGVPLPFISQGGSSLLFNLLAMGLIFKVARNHDNENSG